MKRNSRFIIIIGCSLLFLGVYLCCGRLLPWLDDTILGVKVLSSEEIDALCQSKEDALIIPEILLNGNRLPYDSEQNMLLIPQSLWEESFSGRLSAVTECKGGGIALFEG